MSEAPTVAVVVPAKNEARTIQDIVEGAARHADEVVVLDGHSEDGTREIATAAGARVVLDSGRGKGAAIRQSLEEVHADIVVFMDADGSHDPDDIPRLVQPILDDEADLVIGCRMTGGSDELHGDVSRFVRLTGSQVITLIINYRFNVRLTDVQNGFRAIRRDVARAVGMVEDTFTIEEEMVMKCLKHKCRVKNVPSHEYERRHGQSNIRLEVLWWRFAWCVIKNLF